MLCVCVYVRRGKHVGSVVKKSLSNCWSTVEGSLPVSTPSGLSDLCLCLCVSLFACVQVDSTTFPPASACILTVYVVLHCVQSCDSALCVL